MIESVDSNHQMFMMIIKCLKQTSMLPLMKLQIAVGGKTLIALQTSIAAFSSVRPHVDSQLDGTGHSFSAHGTDEILHPYHSYKYIHDKLLGC